MTDSLMREATERVKHGWVQHAAKVGDFYCMTGSLTPEGIYEDAQHYRDCQRAVDLLEKVIAEQYPDRGFQNIPHFNDAFDTKHSDVIAVMEKATVLFEEGEKA